MYISITVITCQNFEMTFSCAAGETIEFLFANYGRLSKLESHCQDGPNQWDRTTCIGPLSDGIIRSK